MKHNNRWLHLIKIIIRNTTPPTQQGQREKEQPLTRAYSKRLNSQTGSNPENLFSSMSMKSMPRSWSPQEGRSWWQPLTLGPASFSAVRQMFPSFVKRSRKFASHSRNYTLTNNQLPHNDQSIEPIINCLTRNEVEGSIFEASKPHFKMWVRPDLKQHLNSKYAIIGHDIMPKNELTNYHMEISN